MVDLGEEANLGRRHGVIIREEQFELEYASYKTCKLRLEDCRMCKHTLIRRLAGAVDRDIKVPEIIVVRCRADALHTAQVTVLVNLRRFL